MINRYPLDPTGQSPDNLVRDELHTLDDYFDDFYARIILPRYGAYFNDSLVVKQGDKTLSLNKDYQLTFFWQDPTIKTGKPISRAIQITNKLLRGDITITYQVVGDKYQDTNQEVIDLVNKLPINLRNVYWDEILEIPHAYFPERHIHHINDVFGLSRLVAVVDDLRRSLENQSVLKLKTVYDRFFKLKQWVEDNVKDIDEQRKFLSRIMDNINEALSNVLTRDEAEAIIDSKISKERKQVNDKMNLLESRIDTNSEKILEFTRVLDEAKTELNDRISTISNEINLRIDNERDRVNERLSGHDREIKSLKDKHDRTNEYIDSEIEKVNNTILNKENEIRNDLSRNILDTKKAIEAKRTELLRDIQTDYTDKINGLKEDTNVYLEGLKSRVDYHDTDLENIRSDVSNIDEKHENRALGLENELDELKEKQNTDNSAINQAIQSAKEEVKTLVNQVAETNENERGRLENKINENNDFARQSINLINAKTSDLENNLQDTDRKVDEEVGKINAKLAETNDSLQQDINEKIDAVKEAVDAVDNKHQQNTDQLKRTVDTNHEDVNRRIDNLSSKVDENNNARAEDISNLNRSVSSLSDNVEELKQDHNALKENVPTLIQQATQEVDNKITALKEEDIAGINNRIDTLSNDLSSNNENLTERVTSLEEAKQSTNDKLTTLENKLDETKSTLDNKINESVTSLTESIDGVKDDVTQQDNRLNTIQSSVDEVKTDVETLTGAINGVDEKYKDQLAKQKEALDNKDNELNEKIDTLRQDLTSSANEKEEAINNRLTSLEERNDTIDDLVSRVSEEENKSETFNTTIQNHEERINGLERDNQNIKTNVGLLLQKDTELTEKVNNNKALADDNKKRLDRLQPAAEKVFDIEATVNDIKGTMERNGNVSAVEIALLKNKVDDNVKSVNDIKQKDIEQDNKLSEIENNVNTIKDTTLPEINQAISETNTKADEATRNLSTIKPKVETLENKVSSIENTVNNLANNDTVRSINEKVEALENTTAQHNESLETLRSDVDGLKEKDKTLASKEYVDGLVNNLDTGINAVNGKVTTLTDSVNNNTSEIESLKTKMEEVSENPQGESFNEDELSRLVKIAIDKHIAERRALNPDEEIPEPDTFIISPENEGEIRFQNDDTLSIYPISIMDDNLTHSEMERYVFTPNTVFEFGRSSTWTVPDIYDRLIAQVHVTSAIKGRNLPSGKVLYYPPSTRMGYIILKAGENVSITVGEVSSFGKWLTNDGTNQKGTINPTYPITTDVSSAITPNEDIRNMFGKLGKVMIIV